LSIFRSSPVPSVSNSSCFLAKIFPTHGQFLSNSNTTVVKLLFNSRPNISNSCPPLDLLLSNHWIVQLLYGSCPTLVNSSQTLA
jgi:hypothetical protein